MTEETNLQAIDDDFPEEMNAEAATGLTPEQSDLDKKINRHFAGMVVRKDLVKAVKGNAIVPSYVLEYLLGQYAASDDEETIKAGIGSVRQILADHYVHRNQSELVKSTIRERGRHRIIDKVTATLNEKEDVYHAEFANLGIKSVIVDSATIKAHPKLLVGGVWCICDIEYLHSDDARFVPWILGSIKPIQLSNFDFDGYLSARREFSTDEWVDLLIQSIGFNPELFGRRAKLLQLVRLIPFVERNYNLVELGPKGTGKSHIFSEFSPHGMLISGGEVTVPEALRQQLQRAARPRRLLGCRCLRRVRWQEEADRQGTCRHHEELHGQQDVLPRGGDAGRRSIDGLRRQHLAHRAIHVEELRPLRRASRRATTTQLS